MELGDTPRSVKGWGKLNDNLACSAAPALQQHSLALASTAIDSMVCRRDFPNERSVSHDAQILE